MMRLSIVIVNYGTDAARIGGRAFITLRKRVLLLDMNSMKQCFFGVDFDDY